MHLIYDNYCWCVKQFVIQQVLIQASDVKMFLSNMLPEYIRLEPEKYSK